MSTIATVFEVCLTFSFFGTWNINKYCFAAANVLSVDISQKDEMPLPWKAILKGIYQDLVPDALDIGFLLLYEHSVSVLTLGKGRYHSTYDCPLLFASRDYCERNR